jgi:surfactin synthase thioesterase subunit
MKYTIGNLSLNVEENGVGEPALVFLHYWGGTHRTWNGVIDRLKDTYRCVAYDSRGWGKSDAPASGYSIADLADDASSLIQALGLTKYVLVGHSMGGKVAQLRVAESHRLGRSHPRSPGDPDTHALPEEALQQQLHAYDNRETVVQTIGFLSAKTLARDPRADCRG